MDQSRSSTLVPNWGLEVRQSHLDMLESPVSGYSTAMSSPTTPMPPPQQQQQQREREREWEREREREQPHIPHLAPTQPLNINRRQARLAQLAGTDGNAQDAELTRNMLRDRDPVPPPSGAPPPVPGTIPIVNIQRSTTSNLPATTSAVPPPRPARPAIGLGITAPTLQTTFPGSNTPVDRSLLSPLSSTTAHPSPSASTTSSRAGRPSSRRALTRALELAQVAVEYDRSSEAQRAVDAYGKSVALLNEVMERVARGADDERQKDRDGRGGRRRSVVARDEEVRRLKAIHDTYADRMRILCILHSIAPSPSLPLHVQNLRSPQTPSFPPDVQVSTPSSEEGITAIGSTFASLTEDDAISVNETPTGSLTSTPSALPNTSSQASKAATLAQPRSVAQQPQVHPPPSQGWHSRAASTTTPPSEKEKPVPPRNNSTSAYTVASARDNLPPPRPPPAVGLPPLPVEVAGGKEAPKRSPPLHGTLRHQQSLGSLRQERERSQDGSQSGSPTTPTPNQIAVGTASPPRKPTTRSARSASLSMKSGPPPPVPPLPPMPLPTNGQDRTPQLAPSAFPSAGQTSASSSPNLNGSTLVASSTAQGSIAQRRRAGTPGSSPNMAANGSTLPSALPMIKLPSSGTSSTITTPVPGRPQTQPTPQTAGQSQSLRIPGPGGLGAPPAGQQGRMRAASQPGARPAVGVVGTPGIPDVPSLSRTGSSSALSSVATTPLNQNLSLPGSSNLSIPSTIGTLPGGSSGQPSPVLSGNGTLTITPSTPQPPQLQAAQPQMQGGMVPLSPLPIPGDLALRPFHIMRSLLLSILHPPGFYLTPRLFIPTTLWSQGGAKLVSLPQKTSVLLTIGAALETLQRHSDERERERRGGWAPEGAGSEEHWERALAEWERVCEGVKDSTRGKGGFAGIQPPQAGKSGSGGIGWGRLGKQWEKVTSGKNLDSPAGYVQSLTKVFQAAPVLELHLRALLNPNQPSPTSAPVPQYAHLTPSQRATLERRLRNSAEFFAAFVVPFVVRDLGLLMEKYLKKGEKWLVE